MTGVAGVPVVIPDVTVKERVTGPAHTLYNGSTSRYRGYILGRHWRETRGLNNAVEPAQSGILTIW